MTAKRKVVEEKAAFSSPFQKFISYGTSIHVFIVLEMETNPQRRFLTWNFINL